MPKRSCSIALDTTRKSTSRIGQEQCLHKCLWSVTTLSTADQKITGSNNLLQSTLQINLFCQAIDADEVPASRFTGLVGYQPWYLKIAVPGESLIGNSSELTNFGLSILPDFDQRSNILLRSDSMV